MLEKLRHKLSVKRLLTSTSIILISFSLLGVSGCDKKVDGYRCVTVKADNGSLFLRCRNPKKQQSFNANLDLIGKCIRENQYECTWILTDEIEYEIYKKAYEGKCK